MIDLSRFQFSWFFFELIVKSMAQHLVDSDKVKVRWHILLSPFPENITFLTTVPRHSTQSCYTDSVFLQLPRPQRFPSSYQSRMETLVETVSEHIFWKNKELPEETRSANLAVAAFVKVGKCFVSWT